MAFHPHAIVSPEPPITFDRVIVRSMKTGSCGSPNVATIVAATTETRVLLGLPIVSEETQVAEPRQWAFPTLVAVVSEATQAASLAHWASGRRASRHVVEVGELTLELPRHEHTELDEHLTELGTMAHLFRPQCIHVAGLWRS